MAVRSEIVAGQAVLLLTMKDNIDTSLKKARNKLRAFQTWANDLGRTLFRGGALGAIPLGLSAKEWAQFEDSLLFVQTKLQTTDDVMKGLEERFRSLGKTTSFTAREVAEAGAILAQAGFSAKEIDESLGDVLDLARGGRIELPAAADFGSKIMKAFGVDSMQEVADKLIVASRQGTASVTELMEGLRYMSAQAGFMGMPLEEALAILSHLSTYGGLSGSIGGTSAAAMLTTITKKGGDLKRMGIDVLDAAGKFKTVAEIVNEINTLLRGQGYNEQQIAQGINEIFNIRGARAFGTAIKDTEAIEENMKEMNAQMGEAHRNAQLMDSRLGGAFRKLRSVVQELALAVGKLLSPGLIMVMEQLRDIINKIAEIIKQNPQIVAFFTALTGGALVGGIGLLGAGMAAGAIANILSLISLLSGAALTVGAGAVSLLFNPVAWGIAATAAITSLFIPWRKIGEYLSDTLGKLYKVYTTFIKDFDITKAWKEVLRIMDPWIARLRQAYEIIKTIGIIILDALYTGLKNTFLIISTMIGAVFGGFSQGAAGTIGSYFELFKFAVENWQQGVIMLVTALEVFVEGFTSVVAEQARVMGKILKAQAAMFGSLVNGMSLLTQGLLFFGQIFITGINEIAKMFNMKPPMAGVQDDVNAIMAALAIGRIRAAEHSFDFDVDAWADAINENVAGFFDRTKDRLIKLFGRLNVGEGPGGTPKLTGEERALLPPGGNPEDYPLPQPTLPSPPPPKILSDISASISGFTAATMRRQAMRVQTREEKDSENIESIVEQLIKLNKNKAVMQK